MSEPSPEVLQKAAHAYAANRKQWEFLGYEEAVAIAVVAEFFSMGKVRNPSQRPLNVLSMVGKRRVLAIAEAVRGNPGGDTTNGD
jgi:hypothetical protein